MSMSSRVKKMKEEIEELKSAPMDNDPGPINGDTYDSLQPSDDDMSDEAVDNDDDLDDSTPEPEPETRSKEDDPAYWKHRFEVLQGMHSKEISDLKEQLLANQRQMLDITTQRQGNTSVSEAATLEDAIDELESEYGEDFTNALDKRVEKIISSKFKNIEQEFDQVKRTAYKTDQQLFEESLSKEVPEWREVNTDHGFIGWLGELDDYSGLTKHQMLLNAYERQDLRRVAKFFQDYTTKYSTAKRTKTAPAEVTQELRRPDVAPSRGGSSAQTTIENNQGKVFTLAQIEQFYTDLRQGKFRGKEAWSEKMRAEIAKAGTEGRIVG